MVTTAVVSSCIPLAQFVQVAAVAANAAANIAAVAAATSTTACSRKRRDTDFNVEQAMLALIEPSDQEP